MAIITLTTDFGEKDYYAGALKGAIYSELGSVNLIDITHSVSPFNTYQAAYLLRNSYKHFPKGTVHLIGVDTERTLENTHIAMAFDGHYFIGADNGILSLLTAYKQYDKLVEIALPQQEQSAFSSLDIFAKVACHIARGGTLEVIGKPFTQLKEVVDFIPVLNQNMSQLAGKIIYIDNYGNVITNITKAYFEQVRQGRPYEVMARNYRFQEIYNTYSEAINFSVPKSKRNDDGKKLALFNSSGHLEIAIYKSNLETVGGASTLLGLQYLDPVSINFL